MVTKGEVIDFLKQNGMSDTVKWFEGKHDSIQRAAHTAYRSKVDKINKEYRTISKNKAKVGHEERMQTFNGQQVEFPLASKPKKRKVEDVDLASKSVYVQNVETLKDVSADLAGELLKYKTENEALLSKVDSLSAKFKAQQQSKMKLLQRKESQMNKMHLRQVSHLKNLIWKKNKQLKTLRLRSTFYEKKANSMTDLKEKLCNEISSLKQSVENYMIDEMTKDEKIKSLENDKRELIAENEWLSEMCNDTVKTFNEDSRAYTPETQQCVYSLLEHNVSTTKIPLVIRDVLKLVNVKASHLPSKSTCNNMNIQRLHLAQRQLAEEFTTQENTCLLSDETSKYGQKFEGFHAVDKSGRTWVLGLRQMATKSGQSALDTFKEILGDIEDSFSQSDSKISDQILMNISSTMSDRAATQKKFNELLEDFRTDVLKTNVDWDALSENEKSSMSRLMNFFCSLHVLVHLAEGAAKALVETDKLLFEDPPIYDVSFRKPGESGTTRLIRCCSKAFARGGDERNGAHGPFLAYIQDFLGENGFFSLPLERFRGNRFNILFNNAAVVYFLSNKFIDFLNGSDNNRLLKAVKHDLSVPEYIAGCRALGLVSELITKPFWCLIENGNISILDMQDKYMELINYLNNLDAAAFMNGLSLLSFVNKEHLGNSPIFKSLIHYTEIDDKVVMILSVLIPALKNVTQSLLKDFLPGGQWYNCDQSTKDKVQGTPKHNKFSETVFGQLDRILREKPNVSILTSEAIISFCHNKTLAWIMSKPGKEREELCTAARKSTKELRRKFKEREQEIKTQIRRNVELKIQKEKEQAQKKIQHQEKLINEIQYWGLWQSHEEIDSALNRLTTKGEKMAALKAQLSFRKHIFKQSSDIVTCSFSKKVGDKRVNLSIEELTASLKQLVIEACTVARPSAVCPLLVGKKVRHAFQENDSEIWYIGRVISQVPGYSDWYNIKYSGDPSIYTYQLLKEYHKGDLEILL